MGRNPLEKMPGSSFGLGTQVSQQDNKAIITWQVKESKIKNFIAKIPLCSHTASTSGGMMILIKGRGMRLRDYVLSRREDEETRGIRSVFGESIEGEVVAPIVRNLMGFSYLYTSNSEIEDKDIDLVYITIPPTCRGLKPYNEADLPYGWTGQINEYVAEMAVCWAFDLLSQQETDFFLIQHRPAVIFQYFQDGRFQDMPVYFNGSFWEIITGGVQ